MKEIQEHKIKIYEFPDTEDDEDNKLIRKIKVLDHSYFRLETIVLCAVEMDGGQQEAKVSLSSGRSPSPAAASVPFAHGCLEGRTDQCFKG